MASTPVLRVSDITVRLTGRTVLDSVGFELNAGEFTGLIGSNGAGKTTLFRVILGLQSPAAGAVEALGPVDTTGDGRRRRGLGRQERRGRSATSRRSSCWTRTCRCAGATWSRLGSTATASACRVPRARRRELVEQMLEAVDAAGFADARVGELSGGEQQRILIAHALDQPAAAAAARRAAREPRSAQRPGGRRAAARIAREQQMAVLISAHEMNPLLPVMDRVVYLADGRAACGTTDEVVRSDVLSRLYGHHVDVLRVHGRVIVVAGEGEPEEDAVPSAPTSSRAEPRRVLVGRGPVGAVLHAIVEPGFFSSSAVQLAAGIGAIVAIVAAAAGVFTVIRGQAFAGEALGDIGAAGGSSAYLSGIGALWGFLGIAVAAAGVMELIGIQRARGRDLATGIVLGAGFGLAALFLYLGTTSTAPPARRSRSCSARSSRCRPRPCRSCSAFGAVTIAALAVVYRPLLLVSVSPELAAARGIPVRRIGVLYLLAMAVAVALSAMTIGAILSTALLVGPAATALRLTTRPGQAIAVAGAIGVAVTWLGLLLA